MSGIVSERIISRIEEIKALDTTKIVVNDEGERQRALTLSRSLTTELEGGINRVLDVAFKPFQAAAIRVAIDLNLFSLIISAPSGSIGTKELAKISGGEEYLISRVLRLLATGHLVEERARDDWSANETTKTMVTAEITAGYRFIYDVVLNSITKAPQFLRETGFQSPTEPQDGLVQFAHQTKLGVFDYLASEKPSLFHDFNLFMGFTFQQRDRWFQWYDVHGRLLDGFDTTPGGNGNNVFFVEVAGGKGHDLQAFFDAFKGKGLEGDLVLQDQKKVIDSIADGALDPSIKKVAYNFFTPQTIKGARVYSLRRILHDWSDKYCRIILSHLKEAMAPGYSKLLIHDLILPDSGVDEFQAHMDITMMIINGGAERTRSQWTVLLEDFGFHFEIYERDGQEGIIEAMLPV